MTAPRVSVVLPARNGLPWLREALDSLYAQTFGDFEVVVVDDGSTDGTGAWLQGERDPRLRVVAGPGRGLAVALNTGLAHATGALIARQDADDRSHPERLARQVAFMDAHPDVSVLATCAEYIDADGAPVENAWTRSIRAQQDAAVTPEALRALLPLTCCIVHGSVMMRAAAVCGVGGYRNDYVAAQDYDLWLRLLPAHRFAKLPERLYAHRVHPQQLSGRRAAEQRERAIRAKLEFVRRTCPWLPAPADLAVADDTRGTAAYLAVAPDVGFRARPAAAAWPWAVDRSGAGAAKTGRWDVLVVTDFSQVDAHAAKLAPLVLTGRVIREGNLFIRVREAA